MSSNAVNIGLETSLFLKENTANDTYCSNRNPAGNLEIQTLKFAWNLEFGVATLGNDSVVVIVDGSHFL